LKYRDVILLSAIVIVTSTASWQWNCTCASNNTCPCVFAERDDQWTGG